MVPCGCCTTLACCVYSILGGQTDALGAAWAQTRQQSRSRLDCVWGEGWGESEGWSSILTIVNRVCARRQAECHASLAQQLYCTRYRFDQHAIRRLISYQRKPSQRCLLTPRPQCGSIGHQRVVHGSCAQHHDARNTRRKASHTCDPHD